MSRDTNFDRDLEVTISNIKTNNESQSLETSMTLIAQCFIYIAGSLAGIADKLEERPTAEWIKTPKAVMGEGFMWFCNKCRYEVYQDSSKEYPSEKFCPNCGARMRGEE